MGWRDAFAVLGVLTALAPFPVLARGLYDCGDERRVGAGKTYAAPVEPTLLKGVLSWTPRPDGFPRDESVRSLRMGFFPPRPGEAVARAAYLVAQVRAAPTPRQPLWIVARMGEATV